MRKRFRDAASCLSPGEAELFLSMNRYDMAHSLAVAGKLRDDLLLHRMALLHDTGKLRSDLGIFTRWIYTWMELFMPSELRRMKERLDTAVTGGGALEKARSLSRGWRRGFYVQAHHAEIGAELLKGLGSDDELVEMIGGHQQDPVGERAERFARVDDIF